MPVDPTEAVTVDKLVAGGKGLGRLVDGRVVFLPSVVPGDVVTVAESDERGDFVEALEVRVVRPGDGRVPPDCPAVALGCGGCDWRHFDRGRHLQAKADIVVESFRRLARMEPTLARMAAVPDGTGRTTARLAADESGRLGFRRASSHEPVVTGDCPACDDRIEEMIGSLVLDGAGEAVIRVGARTGEMGLWVTEGRLSEEAMVIVRERGVVTGKRARIGEVVHGRRLEVSMGAFFQASPEAAELVTAEVRTHLEELDVHGGTLADLYGGVGLFAATLADLVDEIVLVESNPLACLDAVVNLADTAAIVEEAEVERWDAAPADIVVADPSRSGLGKQGVAAVSATDADVLVLVSCDAAAAARDASLLARAGYELTAVSVLDLFPDTHHVEVVSTFVRGA